MVYMGRPMTVGLGYMGPQTMLLFSAGDSKNGTPPIDPKAKEALAKIVGPEKQLKAPLFEDQTGSATGTKARIAQFFQQLMDVFPKVSLEQRPGRKKPEDVWVMKGIFSAERSAAISQVSNNQTAGEGYISRADLFYEAMPAMFKAVEHRLLNGQIPIHGRQVWDIAERISAGESYRVEVRAKDKRKDNPNAMIIINITFYGEGDRELVTGRTVLAFTESMSVSAEPKDLATLGEQVGEAVVVTEKLIDDYAEASGDKNLVHTDSEMAIALGLSGCILHGVCSDAISLGIAGPRYGWQESDGDIGKTETSFGIPVYPGDSLNVYRDGPTVTVVNQRGEVVLTRTEK